MSIIIHVLVLKADKYAHGDPIVGCVNRPVSPTTLLAGSGKELCHPAFLANYRFSNLFER